MSNSLLLKAKLFAPQLWQQTVRHRGKFNVKRPRPRHDIARYLEEITKPVIIKELPDPLDLCTTYKANIAKKYKFTTNEAVDFEKFMAKYALDMIQKHNVMLICHKLNCSGETLRRNRVLFKKNDTVIWMFNTIVMKLLIENNQKYTNLMPIVETGKGNNYYFFFNEENLKKNLVALRKLPHFLLLGGLINDRLYTRNGVQEYANLEPLDTLRGKLLNTLNQALGSIPNTLSLPMRNLTLALEQHSKAEKKD